MTRFLAQYLYGILIAVTGILLAVLSFDPSRTIQYVVAAGMLLSSIFAFLSAQKSRNAEVGLKYHVLQAVGTLAYAVAILVYATTPERFITISFAFFLYFGITEIIFGFELLGFKQKLSLHIIVIRMLIGFILTIGAVLIYITASLNESTSLLIAGILIACSGVHFILFAKATKLLRPISE